jgi:hypothetical protein
LSKKDWEEHGEQHNRLLYTLQKVFPEDYSDEEGGSSSARLPQIANHKSPARRSGAASAWQRGIGGLPACNPSSTYFQSSTGNFLMLGLDARTRTTPKLATVAPEQTELGAVLGEETEWLLETDPAMPRHIFIRSKTSRLYVCCSSNGNLGAVGTTAESAATRTNSVRWTMEVSASGFVWIRSTLGFYLVHNGSAVQLSKYCAGPSLEGRNWELIGPHPNIEPEEAPETNMGA